MDLATLLVAATPSFIASAVEFVEEHPEWRPHRQLA